MSLLRKAFSEPGRIYRREGTLQQSVYVTLCEQVTWCLFLLSLIVVAFIPGRIDNPDWYYPATMIVVAAVFAILLRFRYVRHVHAKPFLIVIALLLLSQIWLVLQVVVPLEDALHQRLFPVAMRPVWFTPEFKWSLLPSQSALIVLRELVVLAAFISVVLLCSSKARLTALLWVFVFCGLVHGGIALFAWHTKSHLVDLQAIDGHFGAMRGLFVNRNHFASFLIIVSLGSLVPVIYRLYQFRDLSFSRKIYRFLCSSALVHCLILILSAFCIVMSDSRAGFAGIIVIVSVIVFGFGVRSSTPKTTIFRDEYINRAVAFLFILFVALVGAVLLGDGVIERFSSSYTLLGERPTQWLVSLNAIFERPLIGYGAGTYATVFEIFREGYPLRDIVYDQAHNQYLHLALEQGLIGLGFFIAILSLCFITLRKSLAATRSRFRHALLLGLLAICCAVIFQSLFDFNLQIVRIRIFFFVSLAMIFILAKYDSHSEHSKRA